MRNSNTTLLSIAPFTLTMLALNVALYFVSAILSKDLMNMDTHVLTALGASMRERLWEGEWIRVIAPMFLHGNLLHIGMNMYFLWTAGPDAEVHFGSSNYGTIYLLSGATGVCLSQIIGGHLSIGASGSLCGILAAHIAVMILNLPVPRYALRNAKIRGRVLFIFFYICVGFFPSLNIDNWGHIGGILGGFVLGGSFELWRGRRFMGKLGVFATLLAVAALICAARWTVFNPTYHIYQAAYAKEELKDAELEKLHEAEARHWSDVWTPLHFIGVLNVAETGAILDAYALKKWNRDVAADPTLSMLAICRTYRNGNMAVSLIDLKRKLDEIMAR